MNFQRQKKTKNIFYLKEKWCLILVCGMICEEEVCYFFRTIYFSFWEKFEILNSINGQINLFLCLGKLYFSTERSKPYETASCKVLNIDNAYSYEGYNSDFGTLTLNFVHKFIKEVNSMMGKYQQVIHHCNPNYRHEANGSFLMGSYLIISKKWSVDQVKEAFGASYLSRLRPFRDAGIGPDDFPLTVIDCLKGIDRAVKLNWYSEANFDCYGFE